MGPVRILVVDDFEPWRRTVCSILAEDSDLEVVGEGVDGLDAVQKCTELQPDLVVLDMQMPKMNGLEAARQIHTVSPNTKVLFVSSIQSLEIMRKASMLGFGFVMKADVQRDLLPVVKAAIRDEPFVRFRFLDKPPTSDQL